MSTQKPKCLMCSAPLRRPLYDAYGGKWGGKGYDGNGLFCTLRCGAAYAVAAVRSGRVS